VERCYDFIQHDYETAIRLPLKQINEWKAQFVKEPHLAGDKKLVPYL
jgi:hypothetical protein